MGISLPVRFYWIWVGETNDWGGGTSHCDGLSDYTMNLEEGWIFD